MRSASRSSIPQGTLGILILQTEGLLYPALQRLLLKGFLVGERGKLVTAGGLVITG